MARDGREFCLLEALERYFSELQIKMKTNDCRIEILRLKNALSLLIEEIGILFTLYQDSIYF